MTNSEQSQPAAIEAIFLQFNKIWGEGWNQKWISKHQDSKSVNKFKIVKIAEARAATYKLE